MNLMLPRKYNLIRIKKEHLLNFLVLIHNQGFNYSNIYWHAVVVLSERQGGNDTRMVVRGTSSGRDNWQGGGTGSSLQDDRNRSRVGITHNPGPGLLGKFILLLDKNEFLIVGFV